MALPKVTPKAVKQTVLAQIDFLTAIVLVPVGTVLALYVRGVSYRDLHLLLMDQDGVLSYLVATHFEYSNSFVMREVAFPSGLSIFAWPGTDYIFLGLVFVLTKLSGSGIIAINSIFFMSFGLALASSYWVLARVLAHRGVAIILAINYAFLPEHWKRQAHLALSLYWVLPLMVFWTIRLVQNEIISSSTHLVSGRTRLLQGSHPRRVLLFASISLFFSLHGTYYSFYFVLLLLLASIFAHIIRQRLRFLGQLDLFIAIYVSVLAVIIGATSFVATRAGTDLRIFARRPLESVLYGGQLRTLAMPWGGTELPLANYPAREIASLLAVNENEFWQSTTGALAFWLTIGLVMMSVVLGGKIKVVSRDTQLLVFLSFGLILFYFSGGLGYFVSFLQPQFRAWNRLSLLISFLLLLILGSAIVRALGYVQRLGERRSAQVRVICFLFALLATRSDVLPSNLRPYPAWYRSWTEEVSTFASQMESQLADGCAVYQLPVAQYPEVPPIQKLPVYELFAPVLFTSELKFSYGQMKENQWWLATPSPAPDTRAALSELRAKGYCGILLDSVGFSEIELEKTQRFLETSIKGVLKSASGRWTLYRLT